MRAVAYQEAGPIDRPDSLVDVDLPEPAPGPQDLLVEVRAVSVNPVDAKVRRRAGAEPGGWKVLGWDVAGVVRAVGPEVVGFAPGDEVWYAGALDRPGANAELHVVDARIAARKPVSLGWAEAAALPLTAITAWEMLFDRIDVTRAVPGAAPAVVIVGGAGGVGSIAIQLLRARTGLTVIATASRPETRAWALDLGAHHVIDHARPIAAQVAALGLGAPGFVFSTTESHRHLAEAAELIAPQGRFGLIDDPETFDISVFKRKSVSIHWEFMFTRSIFGTPDVAAQGALLAEVARLVDAGRIRTTLAASMGRVCAADLKRAHALIETGAARGKIVLEGF